MKNKMIKQESKEGLEYDKCYRLDHSKLVEIVTQIKEKGKQIPTHLDLLKDGIYIYGEMGLFKSGKGGKETSSYIGRIIDGSLINKSNSLYLQIRNSYKDYEENDWEVSYTNPNLVDIVRQFIV